jgi:hypothetical protein
MCFNQHNKCPWLSVSIRGHTLFNIDIPEPAEDVSLSLSAWICGGLKVTGVDQHTNFRHYCSGRVLFFFFFFFLTGAAFFAAGEVRFLSVTSALGEVDGADKMVSTVELANDGNDAG